MTGKQKRYLRSLAATMPPVVQIGKNGLEAVSYTHLNSREEYQSSYDRIETLRVDSQRNAEIAISLLKNY